MVMNFLWHSFKAIPNYEILEKIEEGGMSSVYKGRHQGTGQVVAIKIIKAQHAKDPTLLKRFEQEFRACSQLLHPNIVQAIDFGHDDSATYLVMEFVEGMSLGEHIERNGRLGEAAGVCIITQVAQALQYAHRQKMIHRDVKPDNILLKSDGQAKLTDFGLVKDIVGDLKLTGPLSILGTPHFMAPEQYEDAKGVDPRCDIYALGATLYWTVTGKLPFEAGTPMEVIRKQATNDLIAPRQLNPTISEHLDIAIRTAMNPNPNGRPQTCAVFVKSLKPANQRHTTDRGRLQVRLGRAPHDERRSAVRFSCTLPTSFGAEASFLTDENDAEDFWPATVQDMSTSGIGILVSRRFEPGTELSLELQGADPCQTRTVMVTVRRIKPHGFGHWLLGCVFANPLSYGELQPMLTAAGVVAEGASA